MKNKWFQKALCLMLSVTLLLTSMGFTASAARHKETVGENAYPETTLAEMQSLAGTVPYSEYIETTLKDADGNYKPAGASEISIDIINHLNHGESKMTGDGPEDLKYVSTVNASPIVAKAKVDNPSNWKKSKIRYEREKINVSVGENEWRIIIIN